MANPCLLHLPLRDGLAGRDRNGVVTATAGGPVRFASDGYLAEETTTNYIKNPSFETGTVGTNAANWHYGGGTSIPIDDTTSYSGARCGRWVFSGGGQSLMAGPPVFVADDLIPAATGQAVTVQARIKGTGTVKLQVREYGAGLTEVAAGGATGNITLTNEWQLVTLSHTMSNASTVYGRLRFEAVSAGGTMYLDAVQAEKKAYTTSYCDGSLGTGYSWAGTAHASASTRQASYLTIDPTGHLNTGAGAEGAIYVRWLFPRQTTNNSYPLYMGGSAGAMMGRFNTGSYYSRVGSVGGTAGLFVPGTRHVVGLEYGASGVRSTLDGVTVDNKPTPPTTPLNVSTFFIALGELNTRSEVYVSDFLIFDRPLTAAERATLAAMDEWSFDVLQPKFGGVLRIGTGIGLAISSVAAPAAVAVARTLGGL